MASNRPVQRTRNGILRANVRAGRSPVLPGVRPMNAPQRAVLGPIDAPADKAARNPRPRKYPPKYPRRGRAKSPVFSRLCENIPNIPNIPRMSGMRCLMRSTDGAIPPCRSPWVRPWIQKKPRGQARPLLLAIRQANSERCMAPAGDVLSPIAVTARYFRAFGAQMRPRW